jgi:hypothetical protein
VSDGRRFYEAAAAGERRSAPAAQTKRERISGVLAEWLPDRGVVLEIASGTGEHAVHYAERFPGHEWQPSDVHADALGSIRAWRDDSGLSNIREPIVVDASSADWPIDRADAVLSINMVHISPWASALGMIENASRLLGAGAPLILYGPWLKDDIPTAASNLAFDADLRRRDPQWGLRRVEDFAQSASGKGLDLAEIRQMPANNLMLLFRRQDGPR